MSTLTHVNEKTPEDTKNIGEVLTETEKDALGEIGNICMGTSATTLSTLLGKRVNITTPKVSICKGADYLDEYEKPVVVTNVSYTEGLDGKNIFLIKKEDALLITHLLMGGEGEANAEAEEYYISAMSEVMNQMVGSSSTALADILHVNVNISPPETKELTKDDKDAQQVFLHSQISIRISFRMEIEDLLASNIMQIMPFGFGKKLAHTLVGDGEDHMVTESKPENEMNQDMVAVPAPPINDKDNTVAQPQDEKATQEGELKAVKYQSFNNVYVSENTPGNVDSPKNIDLIMDVPLQVTVVLGRSKKSIKEILDLNMGSVIELDRIAGEKVDVLVNNILFARGEVVVIDENYGVRITDLIARHKAN